MGFINRIKLKSLPIINIRHDKEEIIATMAYHFVCSSLQPTIEGLERSVLAIDTKLRELPDEEFWGKFVKVLATLNQADDCMAPNEMFKDFFPEKWGQHEKAIMGFMNHGGFWKCGKFIVRTDKTTWVMYRIPQSS